MTEGRLERLMGSAQAADDPDRLDLFNVRVLSPEESQRSRAAVDLLSFVTDGSPLARLERAHATWVNACDRMESEVVLGAKPAAAQEVQDAFDLWLTAFRGVDYFTREWIGRRDDSDALKVRFSGFASEEFDANAAYRVCCFLRNVAQHAGQTINALTYGTAIGPARELVHEVDICLELPSMAAAAPKYLSPARKAEFSAVPTSLSVDLIVGFATQACVRMFYRLVDAVGPEVEAAAGLCAALHREAVEAGGTSAMFTMGAEMFVRAESVMEIRANGHDQVVALYELLPQIVQAVASPSQVMWRDLVPS